MHANEILELYDRHHKASLTLILTKTHIILSNMKSYENNINVCVIWNAQIQG